MEENSQNIFCDCLSEYCQCSSIHGVQYFKEEKRPIWEKIFWIIVFIVSLGFCCDMILKQWRKWDEMPVAITLDDQETNSWTIPFPAVTICFESKIRNDIPILKMLEQFGETNGLQNIGADALGLFIAIHSLCTYDEILDSQDPDGDEILLDQMDDLDIIDLLIDINAAVNITSCTWNAKTTDCNELFYPIITEDGVCFNFNGLPIKDLYADDCVPNKYHKLNVRNHDTVWNREEGYMPNSGSNAQPWRIRGEGKKHGLTIEIKQDLNDLIQVCQATAIDGYKIAVHSPDSIPNLSWNYFRLPYNQDVVAAVKPRLTKTVEELKNYKPEQRQCFFPGEANLKYFKIYTEKNCELECLTDFTLEKCGCVKFSMPRLNGTRICQKTKEIKCCEEAETDFLYHQFKSAVELQDREFRTCNCMPACTAISYSTEISQSDLSNHNADKYSISKLTFWFKESSFLATKRTELYSKSEFIANCGGLLGLFFGFSALSLVEIFYFSTIRKLSNYLNKRKNTTSI